MDVNDDLQLFSMLQEDPVDDVDLAPTDTAGISGKRHSGANANHSRRIDLRPTQRLRGKVETTENVHSSSEACCSSDVNIEETELDVDICDVNTPLVEDADLQELMTRLLEESGTSTEGMPECPTE
jgi:hypothetical protein